MRSVRSGGRAPSIATVLLAATACTIPNPGFDQENFDTDTSVTASNTSAASTSTTTPSGSLSATGTTTVEPSTEGESTTANTSTSGSTSATTECMEVELYPDLDGDSFGDDDARPTLGCPQRGFSLIDGDCDDRNLEINPEADELCNGGIDDDCDGLFDEFSPQNNTACDGCELAEFEGHAYWFCVGPASWEIARGFCTNHGADLTIVDAPEENGFIFAKLATSLWLGARDVSPSPTDYRWVDGSPLDFDAWYGPNPDQDDGCAMMLSMDNSQWRDRPCGDPSGFVCESSL